MNGSSFDQFARSTQALDPSVKRYAQTKRLLAGSPFGALKSLRNFTRAGLFPSEYLQGSHIRCSPGTTFSIFHDKFLQRGFSYSRVSRVARERKVNFGLGIHQ
jgi:hypothetical protein